MTGEPGKPTKHGRAACFPKPYRSLAILQLIRCLNPSADPSSKGQPVPPSWCSRADLGQAEILKIGFRPGLCFQIWNYSRKDGLTWADKLTFLHLSSPPRKPALPGVCLSSAVVKVNQSLSVLPGLCSEPPLERMSDQYRGHLGFFLG